MSGVAPGPERGQASGSAAGVLGLNSDAFVLLRDLVAERTGVFFDSAKRDIFADKVAELVVETGLSSFLEYYFLLRYDTDAERHWLALRDRLAVPETYFWRQPEQFASLVGEIVPAYVRARDGRPLRIWSAACCTGEEPLSIAIALAEAGCPPDAVEIVASDASPTLLERARRGIFKERAFRTLPIGLRARYFEPADGGWRIDPSVLARVEWRTANLVEPAEVAPLAGADVIFCRNVFIYFSDDAIRRVADLFWDRMPAPGYLFLGASESLTRLRSRFALRELGDAFVYMKENPAGSRPAESFPPRPPAWRRGAALPQEMQ